MEIIGYKRRRGTYSKFECCVCYEEKDERSFATQPCLIHHVCSVCDEMITKCPLCRATHDYGNRELKRIRMRCVDIDARVSIQENGNRLYEMPKHLLPSISKVLKDNHLALSDAPTKHFIVRVLLAEKVYEYVSPVFVSLLGHRHNVPLSSRYRFKNFFDIMPFFPFLRQPITEIMFKVPFRSECADLVSESEKLCREEASDRIFRLCMARAFPYCVSGTQDRVLALWIVSHDFVRWRAGGVCFSLGDVEEEFWRWMENRES